MKKIMIALALVGISFSSAQAQTKGSVTKETCKCASTAKTAKAKKVAHSHLQHSTSGDVYQVCVEKNGHYDCCMHHKKVTSVATK